MRPDFLPPPVSGQPIPHGWFARLYQFLLSLIPSGDGNILVDHGPEGVRIKLNPKLLDRPQGGTPPGSAGGASGLVSTVSSGIASVAVSGSDPLIIKPGPNITLSDDAGALKISASGILGMPNYSSTSTETVSASPGSPYSKPTGFSSAVWLIGYVATDQIFGPPTDASITIGLQTFPLLHLITSTPPSGMIVFVCIPVPPGVSIGISASGCVVQLTAYPTL